MNEHKIDEQYQLTEASGNRKTKAIAVSATSRDSCPDACPLKKREDGTHGCFADGWPLAMHWDRLTERRTGTGFVGFLHALKKLPLHKLWRHNQAGDLPGHGDVIDGEKVGQICAVADKRKLKGATYTHKPILPEDVRTESRSLTRTNIATDNREILEAVNEGCEGFVINLSANNPEHLDRLKAVAPTLDYAVLISDDAGKVSYSPEGERIVWCPAQWQEGLGCEGCGNGLPLCWRKNRNYAVGFKAHGNGARKAREVICGKG